MIIRPGSDRSAAHKLIDDLHPNKIWKVTAALYRKKRSNPQNSFWWGYVVGPICKDTGNDAQDVHDVLCGERFGWKEVMVLGRKKLKPVRGTSDLSVDEMEDFRIWCTAYAVRELGIVVPEPTEVPG